ncbi:CBS domain-containing protein [Desulfosediminicola flagellatus]|uniref:CBS domain-containing protein n=1 Tax=Desulfosediminicola flagellatus TaxID=2569541 RepID=UPI00142EB082|nr:CBS domain-containing protein [Desulfosediminicola flagellatus]
MLKNYKNTITPPDISEQDIIDAMKDLQGYVDITPGDFKQIYQVAYATAVNRLLKSVTAAQIMTRTVLLLEQTMTLVEAAGLLADSQVSGAPVVDNENKIVGIVSEKDFLREMGFGFNPSFMQIATHCLHDKSCMIKNLHDRTVAEIMTRPALSGFPEMTIGSISTTFTDRQINRLPIIDKEGLIVGIVTRTDLAQAYHLFTEGL